MPGKAATTWIVIADGSRARILVARQEGTGFDILSEWASEETHTPSHEIGADRPGRTQESSNSAHHSIEPRHDPHEERKAAFIRGVAARLNEAAADKQFERMILFAPPRCLGELRHALNDKARGTIEASAAKDLTKTPLSELSAHLETVPRPRNH